MASLAPSCNGMFRLITTLMLGSCFRANIPKQVPTQYSFAVPRCDAVSDASSCTTRGAMRQRKEDNNNNNPSEEARAKLCHGNGRSRATEQILRCSKADKLVRQIYCHLLRLHIQERKEDSTTSPTCLPAYLMRHTTTCIPLYSILIPRSPVPILGSSASAVSPVKISTIGKSQRLPLRQQGRRCRCQVGWQVGSSQLTAVVRCFDRGNKAFRCVT